MSKDLALIQTVDFFTPVVDDPYWFGRIAAANAMSDVYAMGGVPKTAMNLVAFPVEEMDISVLRRVLEGGLDTMREAGVVLVGGHSVEDREFKYGLSVTGFIHPSRVLLKRNLQTGDLLILTKPLGTGIVNTAIKGGLAPPELVERVTSLMAALNRRAAEIMRRFEVHACTDVTGFGLLGHLAEMLSGTGKGVRLYASSIPFLQEALEYAGMGLVPAGAYRNKAFRKEMVEWDPLVDPLLLDIFFDPQTSGGLLMAVSSKEAIQLLAALHEQGIVDAALIGEVLEQPSERIQVQSEAPSRAESL